MSHLTDEDTSEAGQDIFTDLPGWMPTRRHSGNFKLIDPVGKEIDRAEKDVEAVQDASNAQTAQTVEQIQKQTELVNLPPEPGEGKESYRARVLARFQNITNEATVSEVIDSVALLLGVEPEAVRYKDSDHANVKLEIPGPALDSLSMNLTEFTDVAEQFIPAGFNLFIVKRGTFTYATPDTVESGGSDVDEAYDDLGSDGEPEDTGGTYAGLIE